MKTITYELDEHVATVTLNSGENRFNPDFIDSFLRILDEVENETDARALVVKTAHEKIFSNGIDLEWLLPLFEKNDIASAGAFFYRLNDLLKRTLMSPLLTVAAINGHAFAGGAIWCCAFDFRFMQTERGFFCFPEVELGIPFLPGMLGIMQKAVPIYILNEMKFTGCRLTAQDCEKHHIIQKACSPDDLLNEALNFAKTLKKKKNIVSEMKSRLYKHILHAMEVEDKPYIDSVRFD